MTVGGSGGAGNLEAVGGTEVPVEKQLSSEINNLFNGVLNAEALELALKWMVNPTEVKVMEGDANLLKARGLLETLWNAQSSEKAQNAEKKTKLEAFVDGVTDPAKSNVLKNLMKAVVSPEGLGAVGIEVKEKSESLPGIPIVEPGAPESSSEKEETAPEVSSGKTEASSDAPAEGADNVETPKSSDDKSKDEGSNAKPVAGASNKPDEKKGEVEKATDKAKEVAEKLGLGALLGKLLESFKGLIEALKGWTKNAKKDAKETKESDEKGEGEFASSLEFIVKELNLPGDIKTIKSLYDKMLAGDYEEVKWEDNKVDVTKLQKGDVVILGSPGEGLADGGAEGGAVTPAEGKNQDVALVVKTSPLTLMNVAKPEKEGDKLPASELSFDPQTHKITAVLRKKTSNKETNDTAK